MPNAKSRVAALSTTGNGTGGHHSPSRNAHHTRSANVVTSADPSSCQNTLHGRTAAFTLTAAGPPAPPPAPPAPPPSPCPPPSGERGGSPPPPPPPPPRGAQGRRPNSL